MIEFAGTLKISAIEIAEKETLALKHITDCEGLVELKAHHCTLVHQKYLKELQKKRKKALKGGESDPVRFPHKNLNISTRGATVHVVHDVHPSTGLPRKSVRLTLNESTQETLSGWVSAF